ncbi:MAG: indolepyruvate/phenylpyruvate decarboxylase [Pseudomonadota bacterium]
MRLTEALLHALKDHGAGEIFGIPGDFALPYFRIIEETGILPLHTLSHEPGVGFAADAAARYRSSLGVAAVTYGAGAFNLVNAVAGAYAEKSPVVVISGAPARAESGSGLLLHHQGPHLDSQYRVFSEVTCAQARLDDPRTASAEIGRVLAAARDEARPVYLELPRDMVAVDVEPVPMDHPHLADPDVVAACADEVADRLARASRPVLMVGVEVRRYGLEARVGELARRLGVPVVTSFMGRGLLASADAPLAGTYLGVAGDPDVTALVEEADTLLLLGVILSDTNFGVAAGNLDLRRTIRAVDRAVHPGHHVYPEVPLGAFVDALLSRAPESRGSRARPAPVPPRGLVADARPIHPRDIVTGLNDRLAEHGPVPVAADMGDCLFTAMDLTPTVLVAPGYYAGMGFGVPAGIGLQIASGERSLVVVGDGAFQMTGWELGNCRGLGIDPVVVVFNNRSWEMLRCFQPESRFNDLDEWRFAEMASGLGGDGYRATTRAELDAALRQAFRTRGRFQLVEAVYPRGELSPTLERFVTGVKRLHAAP